MKPGIMLIGAAALLVSTASLAQQGAATIKVDEKEPVGSYLTDGEGRSVYMFKADSKNKTTCYDACAQAWPPVISQGEPQAGEGVDQQLLGTIERDDGTQQVTYNGWPLYYFIKDQKPGDIVGQDFTGFGAEWYLLTPQGQVAEAAGSERPRG